MRSNLIPTFLKESNNFPAWEKALTPAEMRLVLTRKGLGGYYSGDHAADLYYRSYPEVGEALCQKLPAFGVKTGGHSISSRGGWLLTSPEVIKAEIWACDSVHVTMPKNAIRYTSSGPSLSPEGKEWQARLEEAVSSIVGYSVSVKIEIL